MSPEQFEIRVSDSSLNDLRQRLANARLPHDDERDPNDWSRGVPASYLRRLRDSWVTGYDWRHHERAMNAYPHYRVHIDGQLVHYMRAGQPGALPLLLVGGWPQTFWDFAGVIPLLADFDLIIPDLPGHGFSSPLARRSIGFRQSSEILHSLMTNVLGLERYGIYGTDWGALVGEQICVEHPESTIGLHTTMPVPLELGPNRRERSHTWSTDEGARRSASLAQAQAGYLHMHVGRPRTMAALADSPIAIGAWIVDRIHDWTDHTGDHEQAYPLDALLTTLSIYWFTDTFASSCQFYSASLGPEAASLPDRQTVPGLPVVTVPTAVAAYPREPGAYPRRWVMEYFNLCRYTVMDRGGHFPAIESPQSLAADVAAFFHGLSPARTRQASGMGGTP
jgi:epoxide hydrolase